MNTYMDIDKQQSILPWWRKERDLIRTQLTEKSKTQPLTDVEAMILNPYSLQQARNQVIMLNGIINDYPDRDEW
jgi:hypothetical protein